MDEREVQGWLRDAAESVQPSADLADRAERRYRRRRVRGRVLAGLVAAGLVATGIATAAMVGTDHPSRTAVAPPPTSGPRAIPTTTSSVPSRSVDVRSIGALSFVDANVGFGLVYEAAGATSAVVRSGDGGRTWHRVGTLAESEAQVHFENASDGVAWGTGPLEWTTDGGAHWRSADGPVDNSLAWAEGRLWAMTPCVQTTPCGSRPLLMSDDAGRTWQQTAPMQQGFGGASIVALSKSVAYVVEPSTDKQPGPWQLALTTNGGGSWAYEPVPCGRLDANLAFNGRTMLLICAQGKTAAQEFDMYSSYDEGRVWSAIGRNPFIGGYFGTLTNVGSTFVAAMARGEMWASSDGRSWHRETNVGEGFWSIATVPGVGAWAANAGPVDDPNSGIWFSADGMHWEQRASSA